MSSEANPMASDPTGRGHGEQTSADQTSSRPAAAASSCACGPASPAPRPLGEQSPSVEESSDLSTQQGDDRPSACGPATMRGMLQRRMASSAGTVGAVAAVAVLFGLIGGGAGALAAQAAHDHHDGPVHTSTITSPGQPIDVKVVAAQALRGTVTITADGESAGGVGTGFVFDRDGNILTNAHVVAPADGGGRLTVTFADGAKYPASVVGRAKGYDVAVVKLDKKPREQLTPLALGDSSKTVVGEPVVAAGAPFDLEGTITTGIISATNRPVEAGTGASSSYMNALQTDAPINPGNSGGPLLNAAGQVIGVNSAIRSSGGPGQGGSIGLGFAIPIDQAAWVARTLLDHGQPVYAQIGVLTNESYRGDGVQIMPTPVDGQEPVTEDGPAAKAGLKPGDVITKFAGRPVNTVPVLLSEIWAHKPGERVDVTIARGGETHTVPITLGERTGD
ncbi:trypsin-like peptidase domain-containing protein [Streptomyces sp. NPDC001817]|uniref:S1C family serine protease n=1 Tax=Streptomyces sp. NPDC001817 TaxID=3154398 RepID=UPI003329DFBD